MATGRRDHRLFDTSRIRKIGSRYLSMGGETQSAHVLTRSSLLLTVVGECDFGAVPRDVASNGTDELYFLTGAGLQVASLADDPVLGDSFEFDPGDGEWVFYLDGKIIAPVEHGVQSIDPTDGPEAEVHPGMASCVGAALSSEDLLYVVDQIRRKIFVFRVISGVPVFVDSFRAANCQDVVKVELDEANQILFVVCKKRIVSFDVPNTGVEDDEVSVSKRTDYGAAAGEYTDFQVLPDGYWIGIDADTVMNPESENLGRQIAVFDETISDNGGLVFVLPKLSKAAISIRIPYIAEVDIGDIPDPPSYLTPSAPVISSALTDTTYEDEAWTYTITATGEGPITFSSPDLPAWASLNPTTGVLSGTPTTPATVNITLEATSEYGTGSDTLVLTVAPSISSFVDISVNGTVYAVARLGNLLYVGGSFSSVSDSSGATARDHFACLNIKTGRWTAFDPDMNAPVYAVDCDGTYVYAGGAFTTVTGGTTRNYVSRFLVADGSLDAWNPNASHEVQAFHYNAADDILYVGGAFQTISGSSRNRIAKYTSAATASPALAALNNTLAMVTSMNAMFDDGAGTLYLCGGIYDGSAGDEISYFGQMDSVAGTVLNPAVSELPNSALNLVLADDGLVYVAGQFDAVGPWGSPNANPRGYAAAFDTFMNLQFFDPLLDGPSYCVIQDPDSSELFIGGLFGGVDGNTSRAHIGRFGLDGSYVAAFVPPAFGGSPNVRAALRVEGVLIIAGSWTDLNGQAVRTNLTALTAATGALY